MNNVLHLKSVLLVATFLALAGTTRVLVSQTVPVTENDTMPTMLCWLKTTVVMPYTKDEHGEYVQASNPPYLRAIYGHKVDSQYVLVADEWFGEIYYHTQWLADVPWETEQWATSIAKYEFRSLTAAIAEAISVSYLADTDAQMWVKRIKGEIYDLGLSPRSQEEEQMLTKEQISEIMRSYDRIKNNRL